MKRLIAGLVLLLATSAAHALTAGPGCILVWDYAQLGAKVASHAAQIEVNLADGEFKLVTI
jgi:hypothetical protein